MLGALRGVSSLLTRRRPTHQHPQVLVVINAGGLHVYRLGPSPVLISTFNFDTLVSWQSMNDMLIINIIYATKHDHNKRRAAPARSPSRSHPPAPIMRHPLTRRLFRLQAREAALPHARGDPHAQYPHKVR